MLAGGGSSHSLPCMSTSFSGRKRRVVRINQHKVSRLSGPIWIKVHVCHRYFPLVFVLQGLDRPKFSDTIFQRLNIFQVLISLTYFVFCRLKQFHSDKVECVDSPLSVCCNFSALQSRALGCTTITTVGSSGSC